MKHTIVLKRDDLITDGSKQEHNNIYELTLTLDSGKGTVIKSLTNSTTSLFVQKLNILANITEELILRLLKRKFSDDGLNPFLERSLFLFVSTQFTLEHHFPAAWDYLKERAADHIAFTSSLLNNLHFNNGTVALLITIAYESSLCT
ncbi:unnamed protein product [Rotaria sp. Silwood2]|nr:unnamed protein product [Rotaria sp. Silwood2]CAF2928042.1 unnamed protein product [Rotaria sp. Silwood2]CAF3106324.1 unnamed protein product [Rotaria sp. Silwood2]CAF3305891.1 unnamed protein product [Rotaria sp. Silwood2]CAF3996526.1 unnamed protein product [Rotaria sp. Silwood2]